MIGRPCAVTAVAVIVLGGSCGAAWAQGREPIRGLAGDVRLVTSSVPSGTGWTPVVAAGGLVPSRGFGGAMDAQAYVGRGRHKRLGVGVAGVFVQGRTSGTAGGATITTRMAAVGPHITANFGHSLGWSYLGGGAAIAKVSSEVSGGASDPGGAGLAFHYGGGARWFLTDRVGLSLDLRFWALTPRGATGTRPNAPATTNVAFGVGMTVK